MREILKFSCLFFLVLLPGLLPAQSKDSAGQLLHCKFLVIEENKDHAVLQLQLSIAPGWKLFSLTMPEDQPNSRILLNDSSAAKIDGFWEKGRLEKSRTPVFDNVELRYFQDSVNFEIRVSGDLKKENRGALHYMAWQSHKDSVVGPDSLSFIFSPGPDGKLVLGSGELRESAANAQQLRRASIKLDHPVNTCGGTGIEGSASRSLWSIFFLGFLGGLIALLTPCVFPMVPLTVSFFTKHSANRSRGIRNALLYGFFIFLIYTLLSLPFYFLDSLNPEILNTISTNVWLNVFFFIVFVVFAFSFFGFFEINLPGSLSNSVDSRAGSGSLVGIFFMALTLALVSFSCTGPILGSLLAGSLTSQGGAFQLTCGMAGFGLALALPFALFALFPRWLHSLPKSGGWLHTVKVVLGFLEIALAIKFLSNADLVAHWGILKREIFLLIWVITGILLSLYLFGFIRFPHETAGRPGPWRQATGFFFLLFTAYLVPGLFNSSHANLSLISGFPPPLSYSLYGEDLVRMNGLEANVRNDYQEALALAKKENKPVLIDFTGWACVNCRKMEENVWTDPAVKSLISKNFILVSLYVDDRKALPTGQQFVYVSGEGGRKSIRTIGDLYATFQSENFVNASQPLYVLISPKEELLNLPIGYTPNAGEYAAWLRCGLDAYRSLAAK